MKVAALVLGLIATASPIAAFADERAVGPGLVNSICAGGEASKEKLTLWHFNHFGVDSLFLEAWAEAEASRLAALSPNERRRDPLNALSPAQRLMASSATPPQLDADEAKALREARERFQFFLINTTTKPEALDYQEQYKLNSAFRGRDLFLLDPQQKELCGKGVADAQVGVRKAPKDWTFDLPFRVRGAADGLYITHDDDGYKPLDKATFSIDYDGVEKKRKDKAVFVIGAPVLTKYPLDKEAFSHLDIVPYYGLDRELSKTKGSTQTQTADTWNAGVSVALFSVADLFASPQGGRYVLDSWFVVRPDYLFDRTDHSSIESLNLSFVPYLAGRLNSTFDLRVLPARLTANLDLRLDNGWYAGRGRINQADHKDYNRIGSKFGFDLQSTVKWLPLELKVYDVHMHSLRGVPEDLDDFTSAVSWALDSTPAISLDLSYENGRRENTAKTARTWGVGLSAKY